jgi:hypothetical protein
VIDRYLWHWQRSKRIDNSVESLQSGQYKLSPDGPNPRMRSIVLRSVLTVLVLTTVVTFACNAYAYNAALVSAYFSLALACGVIVLLGLRPRVVDAVLMILAGILLALTDYVLLGYQWYFMSMFSFLGLGAIAVLGVRSIWSEGRERTLLLCGLIPLVLSVGSEWMASSLLELTEKLHPDTLDLFLYYFDGSLGVQASFVLGRVFAHWMWLREISLIFYIGLPVPLTLVYVRHLLNKGKHALPVIAIFLITGPVGVIFYNLFPAAGPRHIFGQQFPFSPLTDAQLSHLLLQPTPLHALRNAIPSLHMTWVLLAWWNSQGLSRLTRSIAFAFLAFTVLATLGTGEHYLIDLIVAFPFALMLQSLPTLARRRREGIVPFLFGLSTVLLWMTLLRFTPNFFWISPVIPWALSAATIMASIWLRRRLEPPCVSSNEIPKVQVEPELVSAVQ